MKKALILTLLISLPACAEEVVRVQATPQVQAANLAPIETQSTQTPHVIELKPQMEVPIKVQATPIAPPPVSPQMQSQTVIPQSQNPQLQNPQQSGGQSASSAQIQPAVHKPVQQIQTPSKTAGVSLVTPVDINQEMCSKMYQTSAEKLFIIALGAIEANNFEIEELQSKGGYITFKAMNKEFLATVSVIDNKTAMLRINPTNGVYHFAPGIVTKIFEYVEFKLVS